MHESNLCPYVTSAIRRSGHIWHPFLTTALSCPVRLELALLSQDPWKAPGQPLVAAVPGPAPSGLSALPNGARGLGSLACQQLMSLLCHPCALPSSHPSSEAPSGEARPAQGVGLVRDRQKDRWRQGGTGNSLTVPSLPPWAPEGPQRSPVPTAPGLLLGPSPGDSPTSSLCLAWNTEDTWIQTAPVSPSPP